MDAVMDPSLDLTQELAPIGESPGSHRGAWIAFGLIVAFFATCIALLVMFAPSVGASGGCGGG